MSSSKKEKGVNNHCYFLFFFPRTVHINDIAKQPLDAGVSAVPLCRLPQSFLSLPLPVTAQPAPLCSAKKEKTKEMAGVSSLTLHLQASNRSYLQVP